MNKEEKKIRKIEEEIDNSYKKYKLYHFKNRPLVQWYLLLMHEESIRKPIISSFREKKLLDWVETTLIIE